MATRILHTVYFLSALAWTAAGCGNDPSAFDGIPGLVDAQKEAPRLLIAIKARGKADPIPVGTKPRCFLQEDAARMLGKATRLLEQMRPDLRLQALDCTRSVRLQKQIHAEARKAGRQKYVADPASRFGSLHSLGCAVDLTLASEDGRPLDLGNQTGPDEDRLEPRNEFAAYSEGWLRADPWANRLLLRAIMLQAGFIPLASEWWHFECAPPQRAWQRYPLIP